MAVILRAVPKVVQVVAYIAQGVRYLNHAYKLITICEAGYTLYTSHKNGDGTTTQRVVNVSHIITQSGEVLAYFLKMPNNVQLIVRATSGATDVLRQIEAHGLSWEVFVTCCIRASDVLEGSIHAGITPIVNKQREVENAIHILGTVAIVVNNRERIRDRSVAIKEHFIQWIGCIKEEEPDMPEPTDPEGEAWMIERANRVKDFIEYFPNRRVPMELVWNDSLLKRLVCPISKRLITSGICKPISTINVEKIVYYSFDNLLVFTHANPEESPPGWPKGVEFSIDKVEISREMHSLVWDRLNEVCENCRRQLRLKRLDA